MEPFEQYHNYSQNLLLGQHDVSEIIKHNLTRGEVREDFIIQYLTKTITDCNNYLKRGFINLGEEEQRLYALHWGWIFIAIFFKRLAFIQF